MSLKMHHLVLYELVKISYETEKDLRKLTMRRPFHYGGTYKDLHTLIQSGMLKPLFSWIEW